MLVLSTEPYYDSPIFEQTIQIFVLFEDSTFLRSIPIVKALLRHMTDF